MRFASKRQLLESIEREHARFLELLASIPKTRHREAGVWGDGWTVQDLVAHLLEWHSMFLRWYREGRDGGTPALPAPGYRWNQTPELNRAIRRKHRGRPGARILREFESTYREIHRIVVGLPPAALLAPGRFAWTGGHPLTTYLAPNTGSHYRFATRVLKRWLARRPAGAARQPAARGPRRPRAGTPSAKLRRLRRA